MDYDYLTETKCVKISGMQWYDITLEGKQEMTLFLLQNITMYTFYLCWQFLWTLGSCKAVWGGWKCVHDFRKIIWGLYLECEKHLQLTKQFTIWKYCKNCIETKHNKYSFHKIMQIMISAVVTCQKAFKISISVPTFKGKIGVALLDELLS